MKIKRKLTFIILIIVCLPIASTAHSAGKNAILIGIDQYQDSQIPPLQSAAADAQKLSRILSQNGYESQTIINEDATKENITEAFIQIEQQTSQSNELDVFLFYFSGRGTRLRDDIQADETQDGFDECLLPFDAIAGNRRTYIRDDAIARFVSAIGAQQVILILDCAFWGDEGDANVKGFGELPETVEQAVSSLDGIEISDGLPANAVILAAALPGAHAYDGVFTTKLLEALVTEAADQDSDRIISFNEAYQYAHRQLQTQQPPRLVVSQGANIPLAPLPPLSRLQLESNPAGAEILIYADPEGQDTALPLPLDEPQYTPAEVPLKQGTYQVKAQKPGFLIPEAKEVEIRKYDTLYSVEPFQLKAIAVAGQVSSVNNADESILVEDATLTLHVKQADQEIHQESLPADGGFRFEPAVHQWLKVGAEYELYVTGQPVLPVEPARFTYDGYDDIHAALTVTLDDIPPTLSPKGVIFQRTRLIVGEELLGSVEAQDNGLGLADSIEIQLQPPNNSETISIPASDIRISEGRSNLANPSELIKQAAPPGVPPEVWEQMKAKLNEIPGVIPDLENLGQLIEQVMPPFVREQMEAGELDELKSNIAELGVFQTSSVYQFRYTLPETPTAAGEWSIAALTLQDKAGNTAHFPAEQIKAKFLVLANRFALGKHYFDAGDYAEALVQLEQVNPQSDNAIYLTALAYYQQDDLTMALDAFQKIELKINYLGQERQKEMPQMPRRMANKIWGKLLDDLGSHKRDAAYISLLAATAEELGRSYEAGVYREYAERLRGK